MSARSVNLFWKRDFEAPSGRGRFRTVHAGDNHLRIIAGDNLAVLASLQNELRGEVTLAYLDPPFLTGRQHHRIERQRTAPGVVKRTERVAFDDRWDGVADYLDALAPRLEAVQATLAAHGSVVVHVDSKTSHYVKVLCDEIFGLESFASEIIWRYRRWPAKTPNFQRVHDVLLRYVKDPDTQPRFNQLYEPLAPSTLATWGTRKQRAVVGKDGRRLRSSTTESDTPGTPMGDVWDIGIVAPVARERTGYPTQKPQALLRRLLEALTSPGDLVLDPYLGSGTSAAVASDLGRRLIGIDSSDEAIKVATERLREARLSPRVQRFRGGEQLAS